jgi:hypothetical protein
VNRTDWPYALVEELRAVPCDVVFMAQVPDVAARIVLFGN